MINTSHYVDVIPVFSQSRYEIHSKLLMAAHYAITGGFELAVSWPEFDQDSGFGLRMRFFGSQAGLETLLERISALTEKTKIVHGAIKPVPDQVMGWQIFIRDRTPERYTQSSVDYFNNMRLKKGLPPTKRAAGVPPINMPFLTLGSLTNGKRFSFFIRSIPVEAPDLAQARGGTRYGLGHPTPIF